MASLIIITVSDAFMSLIGMSCVIDLSGWTHLCSTFLLNRRKKNEAELSPKDLGRKNRSGTSSLWPTYQSLWPSSNRITMSTVRSKANSSAVTHRCLHVTCDFAQSSCNSLDILWDSNWMGSSHDSEWPEHESCRTEHIFVPSDTWEVIALGVHKHALLFDGWRQQ